MKSDVKTRVIARQGDNVRVIALDNADIELMTDVVIYRVTGEPTWSSVLPLGSVIKFMPYITDEGVENISVDVPDDIVMELLKGAYDSK